MLRILLMLMTSTMCSNLEPKLIAMFGEEHKNKIKDILLDSSVESIKELINLLPDAENKTKTVVDPSNM